MHAKFKDANSWYQFADQIQKHEQLVLVCRLDSKTQTSGISLQTRFQHVNSWYYFTYQIQRRKHLVLVCRLDSKTQTAGISLQIRFQHVNSWYQFADQIPTREHLVLVCRLDLKTRTAGSFQCENFYSKKQTAGSQCTNYIQSREQLIFVYTLYSNMAQKAGQCANQVQ